jgi:hypothetical protein
MLAKRILVVSIVASLGLLTAACSDDAEDACEHINEVCASQQGFTKQDCSKSSENYDKLSDAEKEKADKLVDCVMDADTCTAVTACVTAGATTGG